MQSVGMLNGQIDPELIRSGFFIPSLALFIKRRGGQMYTPLFDEVLELRKQYSLIPIRYSFLADQATPIRIYQTLREENTFLLESVEGGTRWARYSFIGLRPFLQCRTQGSVLEASYRSGDTEILHGNPMDSLQNQLAKYRSPRLAGMPPFTGGAVGFMGYDTLKYVEQLSAPSHNELQLDDIHLLFVDELIVYDHLRQEVQIIVNLMAEEGATREQLAEQYEAVCKRIMSLVRRVALAGDGASPQTGGIPLRAEPIPVSSNLSKEQFEAMVAEAKEYIAAGDIFQVVLSQRFRAATEVDPLLVYRILRLTNPSPYMYYFQTKDSTVVGTSPEMLVKVTDGKVETRPIAGTRKRGANEEEDRALEADLLSDEKELAEHLMLLDLGRNDVGRVSRFGSVEVNQQMEIERYSKVMHMVSHVSGQLADDKNPFDALLSCFPAGTVSGSPKLRAMEIITELEQEVRGIYAGAIGYFSFCGNLDSCIAIRTIVFKDGHAYVQAGAGIVADSVPENEYEETWNKAQAMFHALSLAEEMMRTEEMRIDV